jgi:hypothetical protein
MFNNIKIAVLSCVFGIIIGAVTLSMFTAGNDNGGVTVDPITPPKHEWKDDPKNADCDLLRTWAETPIGLSFTLGTTSDNTTPIYVKATDGNKTTKETWGIKSDRPHFNHFGISVNVSPRGNIYPIATYNAEMFYVNAGACIPVRDVLKVDRYDIFAGVGFWIK